jgi:hypothetical protein
MISVSDVLTPNHISSYYFPNCLNVPKELTSYEYDSYTSEWKNNLKKIFYYSPILIQKTHNFSTLNISVYPNPFTEFVTIDFPENIENINFDLYDLKGSKICSKAVRNGEKINLSALRDGLYLYVINADGYIHQAKLIKQ